MGRTNWGPIIIGGGILVAGAYVAFNWKETCKWFNACHIDSPSDILDYAAINALPPEQRGNTRYTPPHTAIPQGTTIATVGGKRVVERASDLPSQKPLTKRYLDSTKGNAGTPSGGTSGGYNCNSNWCKTYPHMCPKCKSSRYTSAGYQSFGTITLNRLSVR